ncbi:MAG: hypothetical protein IT515_18160 [Burkholderiales bacterium]|nr:hypothetical protein [Burkholderiales bacterium]
MSAWSCPHLEHDGTCSRVLGRPCELGMKGCVLAGRFVFADESKNVRRRKEASSDPPPECKEQEEH